MATMKAFLVVMAMALFFEMAMAVDHTVGAPGGSWDLTTNFATWASGQTFTQGDNLIFSYSPSTHSVLEVTKANYDSCGLSSPIRKYASGNDVIPLSTVGTRYFICGTLGHCPGGMKVQVDTVAASTPSTPTPTPPTTSSPPSGSPKSPSSPRTVTPPPPPGSSGANDHGLHAKVAIGFGLGMIMLLAL